MKGRKVVDIVTPGDTHFYLICAPIFEAGAGNARNFFGKVFGGAVMGKIGGYARIEEDVRGIAISLYPLAVMPAMVVHTVIVKPVVCSPRSSVPLSKPFVESAIHGRYG